MKNRVYRSRKYRVIAGVAGGLAEYFNVDVVLVRLLWVIMIFAGGGGILAYIIAWIVIPEENKYFEKHRGTDKDQEVKADFIEDIPGNVENEGFVSSKQEAAARRQRNLGLLLIGLGVIFLIRQFFGLFFHYFWPLLLVALGIFLLLRSRKEAGE